MDGEPLHELIVGGLYGETMARSSDASAKARRRVQPCETANIVARTIGRASALDDESLHHLIVDGLYPAT